MNKYIVANLKSSLDDNNINNYLDVINKNKYDNLIICPEVKYINLFKGNYEVGMQDYYENKDYKYVIIGHFERNNSKKEIKEKIEKASMEGKKIILCIGSHNIEGEINEYLHDIITNNIIIAYEPYEMIGSNNYVNIDELKEKVQNIKSLLPKNINVLYGGNVNEENIEKILDICDGVLVGRMSYNPQNFTNTLNKLIKNT